MTTGSETDKRPQVATVSQLKTVILLICMCRAKNTGFWVSRLN